MFTVIMNFMFVQFQGIVLDDQVENSLKIYLRFRWRLWPV